MDPIYISAFIVGPLALLLIVWGLLALEAAMVAARRAWKRWRDPEERMHQKYVAHLNTILREAQRRAERTTDGSSSMRRDALQILDQVSRACQVDIETGAPEKGDAEILSVHFKDPPDEPAFAELASRLWAAGYYLGKRDFGDGFGLFLAAPLGGPHICDDGLRVLRTAEGDIKAMSHEHIYQTMQQARARAHDKE